MYDAHIQIIIYLCFMFYVSFGSDLYDLADSANIAKQLYALTYSAATKQFGHFASLAYGATRSHAPPWPDVVVDYTDKALTLPT